jgi:beta-RFAP synthase
VRSLLAIRRLHCRARKDDKRWSLALQFELVGQCRPFPDRGLADIINGDSDPAIGLLSASMTSAPDDSGASTALAERTAAAAPARVTVTAPARLHLGFVDLNGGLGRRFGSLGIALAAPSTRVTARRHDGFAADGPEADRVLAHLRCLAGRLDLGGGVRVTVEQAIPAHAGLGSGTQLALAVGAALSRLGGLGLDAEAVARLLGRGGRSSIGIASFATGGVILDGGRGSADRPPPVVSRLPFPTAWRILLIFDQRRSGLSGSAEREAFDRLPGFPPELAGRLCRLMLMTALPALAEADLDRFAAAVAELQRATGDHFAPLQGGRFTSPLVADVLAWLESQGLGGVGQSSWGPTGFAIVESAAKADALMAQATARWPAASGLTFMVTGGRNRGGDIDPPRAP